MPSSVAFLFDLDGTLVDSVYNHVRAWHLALREEGIELSVWRIHRKIGMSGGLFTAPAAARDSGGRSTTRPSSGCATRHAELFRELSGDVVPLPGAVELLEELTTLELPWAIATSGRMETAERQLAQPRRRSCDSAVVVTRDRSITPSPTPTCSSRPRGGSAPRRRARYVIGDSIWDMIAAARCGALGIGLLSGGYGARGTGARRRAAGL